MATLVCTANAEAKSPAINGSPDKPAGAHLPGS